MNPDIKNSNPDELEKTARYILEYAENLKSDMRKLIDTHQDMYHYWSGRQYDDFTDVIEGVNDVIVRETDKLNEISHHVDRLAAQLRISNDTDVK